MRPNILKLLAEKQGLSTFDTKSSPDDQGPSADYFGETATDFGSSQYDTQTSTALLTQKNELGYLRGERQSNWDKLGNGLVNMAGKTITTAAEGIVNPFYGTIAALTNTNAKGEWDPSANAYYNNAWTQTLDKVGKGFEEFAPTYETKAEATATGLGKLWSFNTISRDILGGAGTTIGAALTGAAWSKGLSLLGKAVGAAGSTEEVAAILAEAKQSGIAASSDKLKYVSDLALKKDIKNGLRQGIIAGTGASGESGAEAREAEKNVYFKLTHDDFGNELRLSEGELEYATMMSKQAGDAAFAMNLPVIMADNWLTFGKALFGNKTNDFAKIAKELTVLDEATGAYKVIEKGKYANLGYRASKIGGTMASEGTQEQLQFAIGKTVEDYYRKKYYNPNAADFADSMTKGLAEAYGTQEGWHSAIIGALSAGIAGPGIVLASKGPKGFKDEYITNPNDAIAAKAAESLNQYQANIMNPKFRDSYVRNANITEDKDEALINNDDFGYHNANDDMIFSYVYNRMQNGKLEDVKQELGNFKDLTVQELKDNYGIDVNINNKSKVDELTSTNAVHKFVNDRLDKIAAIEDTYNAVTKLFPNANPEVKELLMYSAQGLENTKDRKKSLGVDISDAIGQPALRELITRAVPSEDVLATFMTASPESFGDRYASLAKEEQENFKSLLKANPQVNPLVKDELIKKLDDLGSLTSREQDFVAAYNALKNPQVQDQFLQKSKTLWDKYTRIAEQKDKQDFEEETQITTPEGDTQVPPDLTGNVEGVPAVPGQVPAPVVAVTVDPANPLAQWFNVNKMDYTTSEEDLMASLQDDVQSNRLTTDQAQAVLNDWQANQGKQPVATQTTQGPDPAQTIKDPKRPQSFLMTKVEDRDSAIQSNGAVIGNFRGTKEDGTAKYPLPVNGQPVVLATFAEVQSKLKDIFNSKENLNDHINFEITDTGYVLIFIDDIAISVVDNGKNFQGTDEQKKAFYEITHLFYDQKAKARSIQELNANKALINFTTTSLLNFTTNNEATQTTLETLLQENPQIPFTLKIGALPLENLNTEEDTDIYYEEELNGQTINPNESIANIQDGLHLEISENSYPQLPIKVRIAPHANVQEELDKVNSATTPEEKIAAVKAFNKEVFIALKPVEGVQRRVSLFYDTKSNVFAIQINEKPNGAKWEDKTTRKTAELILPEVSADGILEKLNSIKINGKDGKASAATDFKYNTYIDANKQIIPSRLSVPIGEEGLFKFDLKAQIADDVKPVTSTVVTPAPVVTTQPTITLTNEEQIAKYRADEQAELLKAIPNIADFLQSNFMGSGTTYGENQGNMPDDLYAVYKPIYDKYNKLITDVSEGKPTTDTKADIIQTNEPNIQTVGNVTFGTANKQGQTDNNEDAVYVDTQNGIFILADGMGGEGMITQSPSQTSKSVINKLLGKTEQNFTDLIYEEYLKNKNITVEQISDFLVSKGFKKPNSILIRPILTAFQTKGDLTNKKGFRSGATALKAVKTSKNTYTIEKVGDTVYFVVDKNGKVTQSHGLSDVATTQGYMFSVKDGKPYTSTPKTDKFTITLNEGERLVLATDFIETDKAIQDFINSDFGKNLDFAKFQKENKTDDSTFITITYDAELAALENKPTTSSTANTELEADFATMNNSTLFIGKVKEDLINKWNKILSTNFPLKPKSAQLSLFKSTVESYLNNLNPNRASDVVYSIGLEESTGITQKEVNAIKAILPKFISIDDIKTIAQNLKIKGIAYGAFKNKVIYLNTTKGKPGTAYHEAFHAVFRTMLTNAQIEKYLMASAKDFVKSGKNMEQEISKLRETVADYLTKSDLELQTIVLEEHMADKFQSFSENKVGRETEPLLRQLFMKIKEFFKQLFRIGNELDMFYSNILNGAFVNATPISNVYTKSSDTVFKLLPNKYSATENGFFTAQESRKIINSFAIDVYKAKTGKYSDIAELYNDDKSLKSDQQVLDYFINKRIDDLETKGRDYADSFSDTDEVKANEISAGIDKELYLYNKNNNNSSKINGYEVLVSSVLDNLKIFNFKNSSEDATDKEGGDEKQEVKEKFGSQDAWLAGGHDSLSQTIKRYAAFTTRTEIDPLTNEERQVAIDSVTLYNGLTRILADTAEENMIAKLHYASESNPNVEAFYNQMIKDLGVTFNPEEGTITTPNNSNNYNIYRAFLSNFKKSRISQLDVLLGKTGLSWGNANQNDPAKVSLTQWENNLLVASVKDKGSIIAAANKIYVETYNFIKPKKDNVVILDNKVKLLKTEFSKLGINLTTAYIKYSILKQKSLLESVQKDPSAYLTKDQITFLNSYDKVIPINFDIFAPKKSNLETYSISKKLESSSNPIDIYKKEEGLSQLKTIAENNALFDESIGNFSFTNAEGERVHEIINKSYVIEAISKFKDGVYLKSLVDGTAIGLNETETKNNYFLKNNLLANKYQDYLKDLKLNILSGIRDINPGSNNESKPGITFGKFDGRSYLVSALALFNNNGNKDSGKYIFRQNEASNTAYVAELPKLALVGENTMDTKTINEFFGTQFLNEFERIGREKKLFDAGKGVKYEKYNTKLTDKAFDFTEFKYLEDTLGKAKYQEILNAALESTPLNDVQMAEVLGGVTMYLNTGFADFLKLVDNYGLKFVDGISKDMLSNASLKNFYINDYIMSTSINELLDGDYGLSRKDNIDISKRNKSAMASGMDYGKGSHNSAIIKDIPVYVVLNTETNVLERVTKQGDSYFDINNKEVNASDVKEINSNDAQSYAAQHHIMMGSLRMGRLDDTTREIYKNIIQFTKRDKSGKIVRDVNIGNENQSYLSDTLASLNSKKTVAFDGVNALILKMSEFGLVRSSISYIEDKDVDTFVNLTNELTELMFGKDDFESEQFRDLTAQIAKLYKPVPGMEYWHKLANNMDKNAVDHVATQSASKGATMLAEDSLSDDLNLSKSRFKVANNTKRLQVETPTGKKDIVFGSQILTIITSELDDNSDVNFLINGEEIKNLGKLREVYNDAINNSRNSEFTKAIAVIKDLKGKALSPNSTYEGMIDTTELDEIIKRSLAASGADVQQMQYFEGGYNYNMIQMLVKAEQVILAHFSKGVLNQKVNGDKVSLLAGSGITVVRDINTNKVISHHEVVKNPSKYSDKSKYTTNTTLRYNVEDKDGRKYSECILSQAILTRHGLKVGDMITEKHEEILKMFGYRIPTGDKQSAMSLKVVSLLPDYYNGVGIFPDEIVYLSGADFDIDSEFIQMPAFWINSEGAPVKFGTEKTDAEKFEAYQYYNKKYDKNFKAVYNTILSKDTIFTSLKQEKDRSKAEVIENIARTEAYKEASIKLGLPYTQEDFTKSGLQPTANYNNTALDAMIGILTNDSLNNITSNTTSTKALVTLSEDLIKQGFIKQTEGKIQEKNKSAHDINGKFDSNKKNSDGKNGIGIAANKIQQFAFLMSKLGNKSIIFNGESFKFDIAGQVGGEYKQKNKEDKRIADNLNLLLNAFTDNAKDPIAGRLNLKFELLGGAMELVMQGMTFENTMKLINLPIIQEYGELAKTLKYALKSKVESNFTKESIKEAAVAKILYPNEDLGVAMKKVTKAQLNPEQTTVSLQDIENILLGNEFQPSDATKSASNNDVQLQALFQFLKVVDQNNVMSNINTFLKLNQGLDVSFTGLHDELHQAIDTFKINELVGAENENLEVTTEPHINITDLLRNDKNTLDNIKRALTVESQVGQKIFIEQTKVFKKEFQKFLKSLNPSFVKTGDNLAKISREFLGFLSIKAYVGNLEKLKNDLNTPEVDKEAINKRLKSIDLGLVFNELNTEGKKTLAQQLNVLKADPSTKNNYIVKYFSAKINDVQLEAEDQSIYEADVIDTKSFVKESNETISLLIDSVKSLYSDNATKLDETGLTPRDFVNNMLGYLMVKDNMTFKNNSVAKYLPVEMFSNYSKSLDNIIDALVTKSDKLSVKLDDLGYNFRKLYAADINTSWKALTFIGVENNDSSVTVSKDNQEITFKTKSDTALEIAKVKSTINKKEYSNEQELKDLQNKQAILEDKLSKEKSIIENKEVLNKLFEVDNIEEEATYEDKDGKVVTYKKANYIFPQFMSIRVGERGKNQANVYELVSYSSELNKNKTKGLEKHKETEGFAVGNSAVYKLIEKTGNKGVSVFSPGNYDNAVSIFDRITKKTPAEREADNLTKTDPNSFESIEDMSKKQQFVNPSVKQSTNPYALTEDLTKEISGESANVVEEIVVDNKEKPLINEEKNVDLENGKTALLNMVSQETLQLGGVEFTPNQYAQLTDRINKANTLTELQEIEEIITKCM